MEALHGLSTINIELTSRCNKNCWMCGRRKIEREYPEIAKNWGDMDFSLVEKIAEQLPPNIVVQFHNNGEPLLYPRFGEAVKLFQNQIRCVDTNAKLIVEKADEIIGNLDTITISVIENDPEQGEQLKLVKKFLKIKGLRPPLVVPRLLGHVLPTRWKNLAGGVVAKRTLHNSMGSFRYKSARVVPEIGVCIEALHHMSIDRTGTVSLCVRFDPEGHLIIGFLDSRSLKEIWEGSRRETLLNFHMRGRRKETAGCDKCEYWGCPS